MKTNYAEAEEAFLLSTFCELMKCWKSSKKPRLFIESVNRKAQSFVNFSAFLGNHSDAHFYSEPRRWNPSPDENKR